MSDDGAPEPGCPRCDVPLVPGAPRCEACGLRLVGQDAAALWALDQELLVMQRRRAELLSALSSGGSAVTPPRPGPQAGTPWTAPGAVTAEAGTGLVDPVDRMDPVGASAATTASPRAGTPYAGTPDGRGAARAADPFAVPGTARGTAPAPATATAGGTGDGNGTSSRTGADNPLRRLGGVQVLLLVTGVLLVVVAAIAFGADAWSAIGVLGQAAVLVAVCAGAAAGSRASARRHLPASAEALAVLAVVVLLVLLSAARSLDVLGLGSSDPDAYRLGALLVLVGASAAGDRWLRTGERPRSLAWAAVLLTALVPSAVTAAVRGELLTWAAGAVVLAVLSVVATRPLQRRSPGLGAAGLVVGAVHLVAAVLALLLVDVDAADGSWEPFGAAAEFLVLAGAASWLAVRCRPSPPAPEGRAPGGAVPEGAAPGLLADRPGVQRAAVVVAYGGVVGAVVSLAAAGGPFAMLLLALGVSAAVAVLLAVRPRLLPWPVVVAALSLAGGSLLSEPVIGSTEGTWWRPAAWYALAVASTVAGLRRPGPRVEPLAWDRLGLRGPDAHPLEVSRSLWAAAASLAVVGGALLAPPPTSAVVPVLVSLAASTALLAASAAVRRSTEAVIG